MVKWYSDVLNYHVIGMSNHDVNRIRVKLCEMALSGREINFNLQEFVPIHNRYSAFHFYAFDIKGDALFQNYDVVH